VLFGRSTLPRSFRGSFTRRSNFRTALFPLGIALSSLRRKTLLCRLERSPVSLVSGAKQLPLPRSRLCPSIREVPHLSGEPLVLRHVPGTRSLSRYSVPPTLRPRD